jgi:hypothetical protein
VARTEELAADLRSAERRGAEAAEDAEQRVADAMEAAEAATQNAKTLEETKQELLVFVEELELGVNETTSRGEAMTVKIASLQGELAQARQAAAVAAAAAGHSAAAGAYNNITTAGAASAAGLAGPADGRGGVCAEVHYRQPVIGIGGGAGADNVRNISGSAAAEAEKEFEVDDDFEECNDDDGGGGDRDNNDDDSDAVAETLDEEDEETDCSPAVNTREESDSDVCAGAGHLLSPGLGRGGRRRRCGGTQASELDKFRTGMEEGNMRAVASAAARAVSAGGGKRTRGPLGAVNKAAGNASKSAKGGGRGAGDGDDGKENALVADFSLKTILSGVAATGGKEGAGGDKGGTKKRRLGNSTAIRDAVGSPTGMLQ